MTDTTSPGGSLPDSGGDLRPERLGAEAAVRQNAGELRPERLGAPLRPERLGALAKELPGWTIEGARSLQRTFHWPDRAAAVAFATLAVAAGDALGAAPQVHLAGASVTVRLAARGGTLATGQVEAAHALEGRWGGVSAG